MRVTKSLQPLARAARAQGWTIETTHRGHLKWVSPTGAKVWTAATPSDWRYVRNTKRKLRDKGMKL